MTDWLYYYVHESVVRWALLLHHCGAACIDFIPVLYPVFVVAQQVWPVSIRLAAP